MIQKEWTIDDFKFDERFDSDSLVDCVFPPESFNAERDWNYSSILTRLIQEAGRWCERFASDLFIQWNCVLAEMNEKKDFSELFGFRKDGVDHDNFIFSRLEGGESASVYRSIWRLDVKFVDDDEFFEIHKCNISLYRVR